MSSGGLSEPPQRTFDDVRAAAALAALTAAGPYLPAGAGVMRPNGLVTVCNDIVLHSRRRIVELGGGTSTVLLARLLAQRRSMDGARQVVVEHDPVWAAWIQDQLTREGLSDRVAVVLAPLRPHPLAAAGLAWYDNDALMRGLEAEFAGDQIDLLIVDGPPADTADKALARYPALPVLRKQLAQAATVVLDDVERPGEQEVLRRWQTETGLYFEDRSLEAGVALARIPGADQ